MSTPVTLAEGWICHAQGMKSSRPQVSRIVVGLAGLACVALLGGCTGASTGGSESVGGHSSEAGHGSAGSACEEAAVGETLGHIVGEAQMVVASIDSLECSGDWASASATVAGRDEGSQPFAEVFLLQRDGDIWVLKARETACGTFSPGGPRPTDAEVPADLWEAVCLTS
ncbi:MAG: hypothetical protein HQ453_01340 [Actinobacteria bacterium]|nr:hypothetical protein [Actinomycetota bacterium]